MRNFLLFAVLAAVAAFIYWVAFAPEFGFISTPDGLRWEALCPRK